MIALNRILCPVDFSETTPHGLRPAISLATQYDAELLIVHVLDFPQPHVGSMGPAFDLMPYLEEMSAEAEKRLEKLLDEDELRELAATRHFVRRGAPYAEICSLAAEQNVDLVVMPTRGRTGVEQLIFGSVAERVLRLAPCPVLTVSPHSGAPAAFNPGRIMWTTDFSGYADHALPYAISLAETYGASLSMVHIVTVWDYDPANPDWRFPPLPEEQKAAIEDAARAAIEERGADSGAVAIERKLVRGFDPAAEIVRTAADDDIDLIVMATHGRTGLRHALLGSTAEKVVRLARCPVLTIKHPEHEFITD